MRGSLTVCAPLSLLSSISFNYELRLKKIGRSSTTTIDRAESCFVVVYPYIMYCIDSSSPSATVSCLPHAACVHQLFIAHHYKSHIAYTIRFTAFYCNCLLSKHGFSTSSAHLITFQYSLNGS